MYNHKKTARLKPHLPKLPNKTLNEAKDKGIREKRQRAKHIQKSIISVIGNLGITLLFCKQLKQHQQGHYRQRSDQHPQAFASFCYNHDHTPKDQKTLLLTLALIVGFMVVEVAGGLLFGSLALLADAGHMANDAFSLFLTYLALKLAKQFIIRINNVR